MNAKENRKEESKVAVGAGAVGKPQPVAQSDGAIVEVKELKKHFPVTKGLLLGRTTGFLKAVDGINFAIGKGETLALVGESGCGKTTTAKLILLLEKPTAGRILFRGRDISALRSDEKAEYRKSVQAVFQDPWSSLNPRMKVRGIIGEPMEINLKLPRAELRDRVGKLLEDVGLHAYQMDLYPHEFSGGQRQRIAVARALSLNPDIIVLDEPVSALDVSIRAQIMNLLKDLQTQYQVSYLLIAHHLATVRYMAHKVAVMYLGRIVEYGGHEVFDQPMHPYNKALISAALPSHPDIKRDEIILTGEVPSPVNPPKGCHFNPRCYAVRPYCSQIEPALREVEPGHYVSCHLYDPEMVQKYEGGVQPPTGPKSIEAM